LKQPASEHRIFGAPNRGRARSNRENRRLLAAALERIPLQLEAPAGPPQTVEEGPGDAQSHSQTRGRLRRAYSGVLGGGGCSEDNQRVRIVFLFGAGASYGSVVCYPKCPPLGDKLFLELLGRGRFAALLNSELRQLFAEDFEEGMGEFIDTQSIDIHVVLREMSEYFVPFAPGPNNVYRKLVNSLGQRQEHRIVLATTNYDLLIERAVLDSGYNLAYPMSQGALPTGRTRRYFSEWNRWRTQVLNAYWAHRNVSFPIRGSVFEVLKLHSSCNFLLAVLPGEHVLDYLRRTDSLAPAISMYARGKQVMFGAPYVEKLQARFQAEVAEADKIFLVGIKVSPQDTHIWDHVATSDAWLGYVGFERDEFRSWCKEKGRANHHFLACRFEDALPLIEQELDATTS
jgi:hypothetical protein